ncbi:hypothetical protein CXB51_022988 [Gossypium anomalum]|uniref:isoleucine--tRNA ligase n=1 Tax=Gossypium anomalum TaxID=47600 RepID=A0A8J5YWI1_9ROSI|nr:hypothetical protein CXB51_022988 [Gossypium anomalum]
MDLTFMETVWRDLSIKASRSVYSYIPFFIATTNANGVMPYSTGCKTPVSNFEAGQNYKVCYVHLIIYSSSSNTTFSLTVLSQSCLTSNHNFNVQLVPDPEIMVSFPIVGDPDNAAFMAWTTTPWTLPSNLALCVNANFVYVKVHNKYSGKIYAVAESRMSGASLVGTKCVFMHWWRGDVYSMSNNLENIKGGSLVLGNLPHLGDLLYQPLFNYFLEFSEAAFRGENLIVAVDDDGCLSGKITGFNGRYWEPTVESMALDANLDFRFLSVTRFDVATEQGRSSVGVELFARVEQLKEQLLENNKQTNWIPEYMKTLTFSMLFVILHDKRFHNWLELDFGALQFPCGLVKVVFDLHRHNIDHITVPSTRGPEFGVLRRIDDVFDCWFASGSMPYAYIHYPFENVELFEKNFPGHFVAEVLDQTRGWFYTHMVLSIALLGTPAFRNLICSGLVLAEDGKKMSKRLKSYPSPMKSLMTTGLSKMSFSHGIMHIGSLFRMQKDLIMKVVPYPLKFLDNLTNTHIYIFVRFNRKRVKGRIGEEDCRMALSTLYNVLLSSCKVMAPITPFFTEVLYQNLRKVCDGAEESTHYCSFLQEEGKVVLCEENFRGISNMSFKISLARPALVFKENAIAALVKIIIAVTELNCFCFRFITLFCPYRLILLNGVAGNRKLAQSLQVYLLSRDYYCLKLELEHGNGQGAVEATQRRG